MNKNFTPLAGVLALKKSLFKMDMPAFLCRINPEQAYYLEIIYYNDRFSKEFNLKDKKILGNNYDFLFDNIDCEYSENHLQYIELLKAVKNFKTSQVNIDIKNNSKITNYHIEFHPSSFKDDCRYCILTFESNNSEKSNETVRSKESMDSSMPLVKSLERKLRNEKVLRMISNIIVSDIPLKQIADQISNILLNHLRVSRCILYDYQEGNTGFISESCDKNSRSMIGSDGGSLSPIRDYINFQNGLFKDFNLEESSNTTMICNDVENDSNFEVISDVCQEFRIKSEISIITTFNSNVNGGLFLHHSNPTNWDVGEVEFLEIVAEQFSIAIDRSHSLDKVMEANQNLLQKTLQLRKSLKQEKKMRQMQTEFVAMVSHEFKTPLQIIDGTREVMARKMRNIAPNDTSINKFLDKIKNGVSRLNSLIQSNLDLSKIEMNQDAIKVNIEEFSLSELLSDILEKNSNLASDKKIKVNYDFSNLPEKFNGDQKLLDHCFTNVITNAVKYSNNNSAVEISTSIKDNAVIIRVSDSGIGIPQEDIANIGKKFFRAKNTLAVSGTGIGIYLTKYFIELHKGSVLIESQLNVGTTISISLPLDLKI